MPKSDSGVITLIVASALAVGVAYSVPKTLSQSSSATPPAVADANASNATPARGQWAASAPGRVEPKAGEIRVASQAPGRITDVFVAVNDKVVSGDLMVALDSADAESRVLAAEAEASVRKADRDAEPVRNQTQLARDRRIAEDNVASAERVLANNRAELDRWIKARRAGQASDAEVQKVRDTVTAARDRLEQARASLRKVLATENMPLYTRLEAALAAARAELSSADAQLEKLRLRAPKDGTVLQTSATIGESVAPSPEATLVTLGDMSSLRVRAELEERDASKVRIGQAVIVRSDAFSGRDFEGKVSSFALSLGPSKLGQRGPRKQNDVDVLEFFVDLVGQTPLIPGMRVDVLLKPDETAQTQAPATPAPRAN
jgi:HlyD family secretion protein